MEKAEQGSQMVLVVLGIDGFTCNEDVWKSFVDNFSTRLRLILIIGEAQHQWHQSKIFWSHDDWSGPVDGRYWTVCELAQVFNAERDVRLYRQLREQWMKFSKGRSFRREGIAAEERPIAGRNGRRRGGKIVSND